MNSLELKECVRVLYKTCVNTIGASKNAGIDRNVSLVLIMRSLHPLLLQEKCAAEAIALLILKLERKRYVVEVKSTDVPSALIALHIKRLSQPFVAIKHPRYVQHTHNHNVEKKTHSMAGDALKAKQVSKQQFVEPLVCAKRQKPLRSGGNKIDEIMREFRSIT